MIDHSPLSELDVSIVGGDVRVTLPVRDRLTLRHIAPILSRLAQAALVASKSEHMNHRQAMLYWRGEAEAARRQIKAEARRHGFDVGEGPKRKEEAKAAYAQKANGDGT